MSSDAASLGASLDRVTAWWRSYDLSSKKIAFEAEAIEISARNDADKLSRKAMQERVLKYRELGNDEKLEKLIPMMKAMQAEIDGNRQRALAAERAYVGLTKTLSESPDPGAVLGAASEALRALPRLAEENARLAADVVKAAAARGDAASDAGAALEASRREVAALEAELVKLSNQDITIRQLEMKVGQVESGIEAAVADRLASREADLRRLIDAEIDKLREAESAAEGRIAAAIALSENTAAQRDAAQSALSTARARFEEELMAASAAQDASAAEVERLASALATAEAATAEANRMLTAAARVSSGGAGAEPSRLEDPLQSLRAALDAQRSRAEACEEDNSRLSAALAALQDESRRWTESFEARRTVHEADLRDAAARVAAAEAAAATARADAAARPSAHELQEAKATISMLQSLHFNGGLAAGDGAGHGDGDSHLEDPSVTSADDISVTSVMLRRVRQLEARAVRAEAATSDANAALSAALKESESLREARDDARELCARLEDTLAGRLGAGSTSTAPLMGNAADPALSPDAQLAGILSKSFSARTVGVFDGSSSGAAAGSSSLFNAEMETAGLALALRGQRDRFRNKALALEADLQARSAALDEATAKVTKLTNDNVKLWEKIRFLQFMNSGGDGDSVIGGSAQLRERARGGAIAAGAASASSAAATAMAAAADEDDVDSTYASLYAESMDPFAAYKHGEKARQYSALRRTDRIVLKGSSLLLSSRMTRKGLFLYAVAVHLLLIYVLWHFVHTEHDCGGVVGAPGSHHLRGAALSGE